MFCQNPDFDHKSFFSLFRLHKHIWQSLNLLQKFIFTEWKHDNKKTMALEAKLSKVDRELFYIDVRPLKWDTYFEQMAKGVLLYLNNEHPKDLAAAKRKDRTWVVLGYFCVNCLQKRCFQIILRPHWLPNLLSLYDWMGFCWFIWMFYGENGDDCSLILCDI